MKGLIVTTGAEHWGKEMRTNERRLLLSLLNFCDERTLESLPLLRAIREPKFDRPYWTLQLPKEHSECLVTHFLGRSHLHPIMLPFRLVYKNRHMAKAMVPHLATYDPGLIIIDQDEPGYFTLQHMKIILQVMGPHPEYCGDYATARLIDRMNYPNNWRLSVELLIPEIPKCRSSIFDGLQETYKMAMEHRQINLYRPDPKDFTDAIIVSDLMVKLVSLENWVPYYRELFEILKRVCSDFIPARKALWHATLLNLALRVHGPRNPTATRMGEINDISVEFFSSYKSREIPVYLIQDLLSISSGHLSALLLPEPQVPSKQIIHHHRERPSVKAINFMMARAAQFADSLPSMQSLWSLQIVVFVIILLLFPAVTAIDLTEKM